MHSHVGERVTTLELCKPRTTSPLPTFRRFIPVDEAFLLLHFFVASWSGITSYSSIILRVPQTMTPQSQGY